MADPDPDAEPQSAERASSDAQFSARGQSALLEGSGQLDTEAAGQLRREMKGLWTRI
jgi:hypothetical protein